MDRAKRIKKNLEICLMRVYASAFRRQFITNWEDFRMKNVALFIGLIAILSITGAAQKMEMSNSKAPTDAQKIAQAESAGPAAITKGATIVDMATMKQLRIWRG